MEIHDWNKRYRLRQHALSDFESPATPLLVETAGRLAPGRALDLACGPGRNSLWLAQRGWEVTAVDGSSEAISILNERSAERGLAIRTVIADLEKAEFDAGISSWDFVAVTYYMQKSLYEPAKRAVKPGGIFLSIVHVAPAGQEPSRHSLRPGELAEYFRGWEILHLAEGLSQDSPHRRAVAEIVARKPARS
jgi:tellurite methyltransferase